MEEEQVVNFRQLYQHTQLSLQKYLLSLEKSLDAAKKSKSIEQHLVSDIVTYLNRARGTVSEIQNIQRKKLQFIPDEEPIKNMTSYRVNYHSGLSEIFVEEDSPHPPWISDI